MKTKESVFMDKVKDLTPSIKVGTRTDVTFRIKNIRKTDEKDLYEFDCEILNVTKEDVPCRCKKKSKPTIRQVDLNMLNKGEIRNLYSQVRSSFLDNDGNSDFIKIKDTMKLFSMSEESYIANIFREK
jgi:hypothetical protein